MCLSKAFWSFIHEHKEEKFFFWWIWTQRGEMHLNLRIVTLLLISSILPVTSSQIWKHKFQIIEPHEHLIHPFPPPAKKTNKKQAKPTQNRREIRESKFLGGVNASQDFKRPKLRKWGRKLYLSYCGSTPLCTIF